MNDSKSNLPDFKGKFLSITIMDDDSSHDLGNPYFEYQGGRLFIIGTVPKDSTESNWVTGSQGAVAWDRVTDYFVFESAAAYSKAIKTSEINQSKNSDDG